MLYNSQDEINNFMEVFEEALNDSTKLPFVIFILLALTVYFPKFDPKELSKNKIIFDHDDIIVPNFKLFKTSLKGQCIPFCITKEQIKTNIDNINFSFHYNNPSARNIINLGKRIPIIIHEDTGYNLFKIASDQKCNLCFNPQASKRYLAIPLQEIDLAIYDYNQKDNFLFNAFSRQIHAHFDKKITKPKSLEETIDKAKNYFKNILEFTDNCIDNFPIVDSYSGDISLIDLLWSKFLYLRIQLFVMLFNENNFSREKFFERTKLNLISSDNSDYISLDPSKLFILRDPSGKNFDLHFFIVKENKKFIIDLIKYNDGSII
jgi:hypothetical protein